MLRDLLGLCLFSYADRRVSRIRTAYSNPIELQKNALFSILNKAKSTEFGRKYDFRSIASIEEYQKRLPVFKYQDIRPWIEKAKKGEPNVLWPGRVSNFAISSGTTSGNKYIPVSKELMASDRRGAFDCLAFYLSESRDRNFLDGKFLFLGGSTSLTRLESGSLAGDLSGITSQHIPFIFKPIYEPGGKIAFMADWKEKIARMAEREVSMDIRSVSGVPSWLLAFFNKLLEEASRNMGREVNTVAEVWPNLSLLVYGGMSFAPYREMFSNIIGKEIYYLETYPSSEAFIAIQDKKDADGLLLMLDYGIFFEFVPAEEVDKKNPTRLTVSGVEIDRNYAVIITNNSGLYSYILGDTVRFVSLDPLRLVVTGRIKNFLSAFGEHLIVEEAEDAIAYACERTDSEIEDFTVAPFFPKDRRKLPYHQWLIEFAKAPSDMREFTRHLDRRLRERNDDYDTHRGEDLSIGKPQIAPLEKGTFFKWMESEGKLGGQHKVPRLKNNRSLVEKLLPKAKR
jgi:hypothetical protein